MPAAYKETGTAALHEFIAGISADPALHCELSRYIVPEEFVAAALDCAESIGIALSAAQIHEALWSRASTAAPLATRWPGPNWLPAKVRFDAGQPVVEWAWFGDAPLRRPFFQDEVTVACALPLNRLCRVRMPLDRLVTAAEPGVPLAGLIFHMSRCGSTLLARMLAAVPHHSVASEPEPLDAVLQWARSPGVGRDEAIATVRAMVAALGRHRVGEARRFFIKLDAWHTLSLPLLRAAFPDVPWVYLYRDPVEVLESHLKQPGIHTVAGALPGVPFDIPDGERLPREDYAARALARIGEAVNEHWRLGGGLAVDYAELPSAALGKIPAHFVFAPDEDESAAMHAAGAGDAKQPAQRFTPDGVRKRESASARSRAAAALHLDPIHRALADLS